MHEKMIFVTVGTHEQQFNRLVEYMDKWASDHDEKVIIQTGFSTYVPRYCEWGKLFSYDKMVDLVDNARIVITHGGPSSFIMPLRIAKIPIVVPRNQEFDEHVNNHQITFSRAVAERLGNIILVEDVNKLGVALENYERIVKNMKNSLESNNDRFCQEIEMIVEDIVK